MDRSRTDAEGLGRLPNEPAGGGFGFGLPENRLVDQAVDLAGQPFFALDGDSIAFFSTIPANVDICFSRALLDIGFRSFRLWALFFISIPKTVNCSTYNMR
jgi:hypothetical protein